MSGWVHAPGLPELGFPFRHLSPSAMVTLTKKAEAMASMISTVLGEADFDGLGEADLDGLGEELWVGEADASAGGATTTGAD